MINFPIQSEKLLSSCRDKGIKILAAESCTGGLLSANITAIPGSSETFLHGFVCYSNESKKIFLNVSSKTINSFGAVSYETVKEMLNGLCMQSRSNSLCIAISGVAGPKSSESKPIGLVYIGVLISASNNNIIQEFQFGNLQRHEIQKKSVEKALEMGLRLVA